MALRVAALAIVLCVLVGAEAALARARESVALRKNPIRKVVTMLQDMQKSTEEEGEAEKELFEKFMCYCKGSAGSLETSIAEGKSQIEDLSATVERDAALKAQLEQEIVQHKADREAAEKVLKEGAAIREKEAAEYAQTSGEMKANLQSMDGALAALKKGLGAALLQTGAGDVIRNIIRTSPLVNEADRSLVTTMLQSGDQEEIEGGSDQIVGIVQQMKETMESDLKETEAKEAEAKGAYESQGSAKSSEISAAGQAIESKMGRVGELAVAEVQGKADLENTEAAVAKDTEFAANLEKTCATKVKEQDERNKVRAAEIQAISETIEILNSDDALELFKKTMPSAASFLQLGSRTTSRTRARRAADFLEQERPGRIGGFHFQKVVSLLSGRGGRTGGFEKVMGMVDNMVGVLKKEGSAEEDQDHWCIAELEKTEGEVKATDTTVADLEAQMEEKADQVKAVGDEIAALQAGIVELDKSVAEATEQRKSEHAEALNTAAANQAAVDLLGMAKNRMAKFYSPSTYKEPPKEEEEELLQQRRSFLQYQKSEGGGAIIQMLDEMIKDVELDMSEAKRDEEEMQKDYEKAMEDAATKRAEDSKLMVTKEAEKSEESAVLEDLKEGLSTKKGEAGILKTRLEDLHKTCDILLAEFENRKAARKAEEEGLKQANGVLAGAKLD